MEEKSCSCSSEENKTILGWCPELTTITKNPNGSLSIIGPSNFNYVGFDQNYSFISAGGGGGVNLTINCSCSSGGCDPYYFEALGRKYYGCNTSKCTGDCTSNTSILVSGNPIELTSGGFVNLAVPPQIMSYGDSPIPAAFEAMFYSPAIVAIINNFMNTIYGLQPIPKVIMGLDNITVPPGYTFGLVNICGRATPLVLPVSAILAGNISGSSSSCTCKKGSGCEKGSNMGAVFCSSKGCGSCSLTIKNSLDDELMVSSTNISSFTF